MTADRETAARSRLPLESRSRDLNSSPSAEIAERLGKTALGEAAGKLPVVDKVVAAGKTLGKLRDVWFRLSLLFTLVLPCPPRRP